MTADTSNTYSNKTSTELSAEQIARSVQMTRVALDQGADELPYEINERLRAIRVRALAQTQINAPVQAPVNNTADVFNWRHKLVGWFQAGVAVSAFALALVISVVSIRSEMSTDVAVSDRAISMSASSTPTNTLPSQAVTNNEASVLSAPRDKSAANIAKNNVNALLSLNGNSRLQIAGAPRTQHERTYGGNTLNTIHPVTSNASNAELVTITPLNGSEDDEIAMVLHEQIPLQAYLNDDFARFANHQGINSIEQRSNTGTNNTSPDE